MADDKKDLESGMYNVTMNGTSRGSKKGEARIYHSSTAQVLRDKGFLTVGSKIANYVPKGAK